MNKRVLIVDDHPELRRLVSMTVEQDDYEIHEANDGWGALAAIKELHPDIVILDVMMPGGLDGYQVCEMIKADPETAHTTVILLTARGQKHDLQRGQEVKADSYLVKPFSPLELIDIVERATQTR